MKLVTLLLLIVSALADDHADDQAAPDDQRRGSKDISWDYLLFTQVWPYSVCDAANQLQPDSCSVPRGVDSWTVHGLWPTKFDGTQGPNFCHTDGFDLDKVKPLMKQLMQFWPNLIPGEAVFSLWQHEWTKHGTCTEDLPVLSGEMNYFSQGLKLNGAFSLDALLKSAGIVPDAQPKYTVQQVSAALKSALKKTALVHCLKADKGHPGKWYLVDIRVCLNKNLELIDCEHPNSAVPSDISLPQETLRLFRRLSLPDVETCPLDVPLIYSPPRHDHFHSDEQYKMHSYAYKHDEYEIVINRV